MGKNFQFPLHKVLEYRESKENLEASKLSRSKKILAKEQKKQNQFEVEKSNVIHERSENKPVSIHHLKVTSDYIVQLNDNLEKQGKIIKNTEEIVEKDSQKLFDATMNKKVVEILREKQEIIFHRERKKQELKFNDEQASRISHHKKKNNQ